MGDLTERAEWDQLIELQRLLSGYAGFMFTWSQFETLLEVIIMRETRMSQTKAIVVCSGLGFERKASIARSLLALHGEKFKDAISTINTITTNAERNALIHSLVAGDLASSSPSLVFTKRTTDQKLVVKDKTFDATAMGDKTKLITQLRRRLIDTAGITRAMIDGYVRTNRSLASKSATSPKPPSSKSSP